MNYLSAIQYILPEECMRNVGKFTTNSSRFVIYNKFSEIHVTKKISLPAVIVIATQGKSTCSDNVLSSIN